MRREGRRVDGVSLPRGGVKAEGVKENDGRVTYDSKIVS